MRYPGHDIGAAATRFTRVLTQAVEEVVARVGLTVSEYGVFDHISHNPGESNADLARSLLITPQALGRVTKRLAERGLVISDASAPGRRQPISLTPAGRALYGEVRGDVEAALQTLFAPLPSAEQRQLQRLLLAVVEARPR